jgi:hypothetical protein
VIFERHLSCLKQVKSPPISLKTGQIATYLTQVKSPPISLKTGQIAKMKKNIWGYSLEV